MKRELFVVFAVTGFRRRGDGLSILDWDWRVRVRDEGEGGLSILV